MSLRPTSPLLYWWRLCQSEATYDSDDSHDCGSVRPPSPLPCPAGGLTGPCQDPGEMGRRRNRRTVIRKIMMMIMVGRRRNRIAGIRRTMMMLINMRMVSSTSADLILPSSLLLIGLSLFSTASSTWTQDMTWHSADGWFNVIFYYYQPNVFMEKCLNFNIYYFLLKNVMCLINTNLLVLRICRRILLSYRLKGPSLQVHQELLKPTLYTKQKFLKWCIKRCSEFTWLDRDSIWLQNKSQIIQGNDS